MCVTCGCGQKGEVRIEGMPLRHEHVLPDGTRIEHVHDHDHEHGHDHHRAHTHGDDAGPDPVHGHHHAHAATHDDAGDAHVHHARVEAHGHPHETLRAGATELVHLERSLLDKNTRIAERNRGWLAGRGVFAVNLMSSPGAGKTTLLVRTLRDLAAEFPMVVVEGDQETSADAERIRATGARAVQVNTGAGCHLEADMLERALGVLAPPSGSLLFIENVGNLVCPSLFDLGEAARVVVLSVTEGDDKPRKYPHMFRAADLMILTKTDLLPHVDFDPDAAEAHARAIHPGIATLRVSSRTGEGMQDWHAWLRRGRIAFGAS